MTSSCWAIPYMYTETSLGIPTMCCSSKKKWPLAIYCGFFRPQSPWWSHHWLPLWWGICGMSSCHHIFARNFTKQIDQVSSSWVICLGGEHVPPPPPLNSGACFPVGKEGFDSHCRCTLFHKRTSVALVQSNTGLFFSDNSRGKMEIFADFVVLLEVNGKNSFFFTLHDSAKLLSFGTMSHWRFVLFGKCMSLHHLCF